MIHIPIQQRPKSTMFETSLKERIVVGFAQLRWFRQSAIARNFALNLYRSHQFENMAQVQRLCSFGLDTLKALFKMK